MLYVSLDGTPERLPLVMLALAIVGGGQGLFISPNSTAMPSYASSPRFLKLA